MVLTAIIGLPGQGKTLMQTALAIDALDHGKQVYASYHITYKAKGGNKAKFVDFGKFLLWVRSGHKLKPNTGLLCLDEGQQGTDSRRSRSTSNVLLSEFIEQARHLGFDVDFTTQIMSQVDLRIRRNTEWGIYARAFTAPENASNPRSPYVEHFFYQMVRLIGGAPLREWVIPHDLAAEIWQYYDAWEDVKKPLIALDKAEAKKMLAALKDAEKQAWTKTKSDIDLGELGEAE